MPDRRLPLSLIFAGFLLLILGIGLVFLAIGTWIWFRQDTEYWLVFTTETMNEDVVFQTKDEKEATEVKSTLDLALSKFFNL